MNYVLRFLLILLLAPKMFAANSIDSETSNKDVEMCPTPRRESSMHFKVETDALLDKPSLVKWNEKDCKLVKRFIKMEKDVFEATPVFKAFCQDVYRLMNCDDRIKKYSTVVLREQFIDFVDPQNENQSINVIDHMVNMQLLLNVMLRGAVYVQLDMETDELSILFVSQIKNPTFSKELSVFINKWPKKEFMTTAVNFTERDEYLVLDKVYHCCKQAYHPKAVKAVKGEIKYLLVPLFGVEGQFVLDKIQLRCLKQKVNRVKNHLKNLKDLYCNNSPDFNERYWEQWNDFIA